LAAASREKITLQQQIAFSNVDYVWRVVDDWIAIGRLMFDFRTGTDA